MGCLRSLAGVLAAGAERTDYHQLVARLFVQGLPLTLCQSAHAAPEAQQQRRGQCHAAARGGLAMLAGGLRCQLRCQRKRRRRDEEQARSAHGWLLGEVDSRKNSLATK